jgi:hypothetical protein
MLSITDFIVNVMGRIFCTVKWFYELGEKKRRSKEWDVDRGRVSERWKIELIWFAYMRQKNIFVVVEVKAKLRPTVAYFKRQFICRESFINVSVCFIYRSSEILDGIIVENCVLSNLRNTRSILCFYPSDFPQRIIIDY